MSKINRFFESIFKFFSLIIEYFNELKEYDESIVVPNKTNIGVLFGSLGDNYAYYEKRGRLPKIWDKNTGHDQIVENIFKILSEADIIPRNEDYKRNFVEWLNQKIMEEIKSNISNYKVFRVFRDDLIFFIENEYYDEYIKAVIKYFDMTKKSIYKSRININNQSNNSLEIEHRQVNKYKNELLSMIKRNEWYEKYIDLYMKRFPNKLSEYSKDIDLMRTGEYYNTLEISRMLLNRSRMLLLGNPGSGKTTAMLKIVQECLEQKHYNPLYLELNRYEEEPIDEFIYKCTGIKITKHEANQYVFIFDGLNEIHIKNSKFYNYINSLPENLKNQRIVISCRINNYNRKLIDFTDNTFTILPLAPSDIVEFLNYNSKYKGNNIYRSINHDLKELISLPMILTMLIGILNNNGKIPESMIDLYQGFTEYILDYWESKTDNQIPLLDKISALKELAYYMYFEKSLNTCSKEEAQEVIMKYHRDAGIKDYSWSMLFDEILKNGIIIQKIYVLPTSVAFLHDSLLEFFASKALYKKYIENDLYHFKKEPLDIGILLFIKDLIRDVKSLEKILNDREISKEHTFLQSNIISTMHLKDFKFENYDLSNLYMPEAKLRYVSFLKANLKNTVLRGSDLRGANFTDINLCNADIRRCKLSGVSFLRSSIRSITELENKESIAYVGDSNIAKVWNWKKDETVTLEGKHENRLRKIVYDRVNKNIAAGGYDSDISLWNLDGKLIEKFLYHTEPVLGLAFSPDGKHLVSGDSSGKIIVNEFLNYKTKILNGQNDAIREILFIDNDRFISASWDNSVAMYNIKTHSIEKVICLHKDYAYSIASNSKNHSIVSVGADRAIRITNLDEDKVTVLDAKKSLRDVEFSYDGNYIAVGGKSGRLQIWKDNILFMDWEAHNICVRDSIFVRNDLLITSGDDSSIKVWEIDYEKAIVNCIASKIDEDVNSSRGKNILCDGLRIRGACGLPSDRRGWLYRHGAIREKKK